MRKEKMAFFSPICKQLLLLAFAGLFIIPVSGHAGHKHGGDEDGPVPANLNNSSLLGNKGGAMVVFFFVPFLMCLVPYFVRFGTRYLNYGLLFGAGLFFTLALEHLVPDSAAGFKYLKPNDTYPTAYLLVVMGFVATMLADVTARFVLDSAAAKCSSQTPPAGAPENIHGAYTNDRVNKVATTASPMTSPRKDVALIVNNGDSHCHGPANLSGLNVSELVLLTGALCFHAIFEGLVVGLSSSVGDVWNNTGTIVVHKIFEGLALGMSLVLDGTRKLASVVLFATAFSISAPVGIAIGMILNTTTEPRTSMWVNTVGNGLAAGVFIFVAISHILPKGMRNTAADPLFAPFLKWLAFGLGCMTTSLIQLKGAD